MVERDKADHLRKYFDGVNEQVWRKLYEYYRLLIEWNHRLNLTAIVDLDEVYMKHFLDSLMVQSLDIWRDQRHDSVADIGTGAGFPGLVLALCNPRSQFVLFDSLNKRVAFLETVCNELGVENVQAIHLRAEDAGRDKRFREQFDVVVSRAVARLNVLSEYAIPLVKKNGVFIAYKGPSWQEEVKQGQSASEILGGAAWHTEERGLPLGMGNRSFLWTPKEHRTPDKYPRKAGVPNKEPL